MYDARTGRRLAILRGHTDTVTGSPSLQTVPARELQS